MWNVCIPMLIVTLLTALSSCEVYIWRCGGQLDSTWDSEYTRHGFESQCCQLVDHVTSLGKDVNSMCASPYQGLKLGLAT